MTQVTVNFKGVDIDLEGNYTAEETDTNSGATFEMLKAEIGMVNVFLLLEDYYTELEGLAIIKIEE